MIKPKIKAILEELPGSPGVYLHKDKTGQVLYVGKASNLRRRVRQYFVPTIDDTKTLALVELIQNIEWIETGSELEALFLENEMIKRYKPQYNILLRDDKDNSFVRIDMHDEWPLVQVVKEPLDDGAQYIGPFYSASQLKRLLKLLRPHFPYLIKPTDKKSKLMRQLSLTPKGTREAYITSLKQLIKYLNGNFRKVEIELKETMKKLSEQRRYEQAAKVRDQLAGLKRLGRQIVFGDQEFIDLTRDQALAGAMELFNLPAPPHRIECYDISHHGGTDVVGVMVVATNGVADKKSYRKFKIKRIGNDDGRAMLEMLRRRLQGRASKLPRPDLIIVDGGLPQIRAIASVTNKIPTIGMAKDNDLIVVSNEFSNINSQYIEQLNSSKEQILGVICTKTQEAWEIDLHAGAKHSAGHSLTMLGETPYHKFTDLLKLLQRMRDESHRFAIAYHSTVKRKRVATSQLDQIAGIGPKNRTALLKKFGAVKKIASTSEQELAVIVGPAKAKLVFRYFHPND